MNLLLPFLSRYKSLNLLIENKTFFFSILKTHDANQSPFLPPPHPQYRKDDAAGLQMIWVEF